MRSASAEPATVRAFDNLFAAVSSNPERYALVPSDVRRRAFETFERASVPGGKPGRDWKHDYTRVGTQLRWQDSARPLAGIAAHPEPLLSVEVVEAIVRPMDSLSETERTLRADAFGSAVRWWEDKFASLAVAFMQNDFLIHIAAGARVERPILVEHAARDAGSAAFPYILVVLEEGAQATVVEDLSGEGFACGIVEIVLRDRARLNYVAVQRAGAGSTVLMNRGAVCGADASCHLFLAELGGQLSRSVISTRLAGRGASSEVAGFFFNSGEQHVDLSTTVDHATPDTTSRTTVKSAATGRGQGRYLGNIRIAAHANGSDAVLRDDALLLSKHAHIDSVPALEIASNDVKAFHGATVGSIDEAELFYAQTRGIERSDAERMIALGFFEPVIAGFPEERIRERLRASLAAKATTVPLAEVS